MFSVPRAPSGFKYCVGCEDIKLLFEFHKDKSRPDGYATYCKCCVKKYYNANADRISAVTREWQKKNPEKTRQYVRDYFKRHPEFAKRANDKRAKHVNGKKISDADIESVYKSQKGLCWWCGQPVGDDWEIDHRIALSKGGLHSLNNICVSCKKCNRLKSNKMPWEFNGRLL